MLAWVAWCSELSSFCNDDYYEQLMGDCDYSHDSPFLLQHSNSHDEKPTDVSDAKLTPKKQFSTRAGMKRSTGAAKRKRVKDDDDFVVEDTDAAHKKPRNNRKKAKTQTSSSSHSKTAKAAYNRLRKIYNQRNPLSQLSSGCTFIELLEAVANDLRTANNTLQLLDTNRYTPKKIAIDLVCALSGDRMDEQENVSDIINRLADLYSDC